jgi:formate dehydrogenase subunit gamma
MRALRNLLAAALLALPMTAGAQLATDQSAAPPAPPITQRAAPGSPEIQSAVPNVGESRGGGPNTTNPETSDPQRPTGVPAGPPPRQAAPTPVAPIPAPAPGTALGLSAEELELQRTLQGGRIEGRITIPNETAAVLIQPEGRDWRHFHNVTLTWVGGVAIGGMLLILALFYLTKGRIKLEGGRSGRTITRFNALERANHWMTASTFIILGLTGLNLTFGRWVILPWLGPEAFYAATHYGKIAHNYLSFPFTLGITVMLLLWVKDNIPNRVDVAWLKAGGGFFNNSHPDAERFNAGQKMVFWITVLGGAAVAVSGYLLIFPFWGDLDVNDMQLAHTVHALISVLMVAAMIAHIYIGSLGMEGAYDAMGSGEVDLGWAKTHHKLWVDQEMAKARETITTTGGASPRPAE